MDGLRAGGAWAGSEREEPLAPQAGASAPQRATRTCAPARRSGAGPYPVRCQATLRFNPGMRRLRGLDAKRRAGDGLRERAWVLDSGLRRNDERVGLAVDGLRAGGAWAGSEREEPLAPQAGASAPQRATRTCAPARRRGAGHYPVRCQATLRFNPGMRRLRGLDAKRRAGDALRVRAWVLDSGLRRNDERVELAVDGLRAGGAWAGSEREEPLAPQAGASAPQRATCTCAPARRSGAGPIQCGVKRHSDLTPGMRRLRGLDAKRRAGDALRERAWVLDSGLRRNDERVGLAVDGRGAYGADGSAPMEEAESCGSIASRISLVPLLVPTTLRPDRLIRAWPISGKSCSTM